MTTAEEELRQTEANAATNDSSSSRSRSKKPDAKIEKSLALAADTQYQNGAAMVERIAQQSFYRGVEDAVTRLIDSSTLAENDLDAIAAKFQKAASLRSQPTQSLILPASAWLEDDE